MFKRLSNLNDQSCRTCPDDADRRNPDATRKRLFPSPA
jgi:hypothetical protein